MKDNENKKTELFETRVELFFKALMLHKAAILANRYKFRTNFYNFSNLKMLNKSVYDTEACAEIFRSLFFDVPVVDLRLRHLGDVLEILVVRVLDIYL